MSAFYEDLQRVATGILAEFKQEVISLKRNVEAASEASTPWEPGSVTSTVYDLQGTARGVQKKYVDGVLIQASDLQVTISVIAIDVNTGARVEIEPMLSDTIVLGGVEHRIKRVDKTPAAGTAIVYTLFIEA